jgi:hypothetical protein
MKDISYTEESTAENTRFLDESYLRQVANESITRYKANNSFSMGYSPDVSRITQKEVRRPKALLILLESCH